jgi:phosphotransferase family enzyme
VPSFRLSRELLTRALDAPLLAFRAEQIKTTFPWSLVFRVALHVQGHPAPKSVVVKAIDPHGPADPHEGQREFRFYQSIYPGLPQPKPRLHALSVDDDTGWYVIVLEDLSASYRIPQHPYQWSRIEMQAVLRAYAALHSAPVLPSESDRQWLNPRHEIQLDFDMIPEQVATVQRLGIWGDLPGLPDLMAYARESCQKYAELPVSLLHNDTTPTNAPLPRELASQPALLIDWQDAGIGMPEMDLAYIDLQPFRSGRLIPREELLSTYWKMRGCLHGDVPPPGERSLRQIHADLIMALWLTRPAGRVALHPYPEGTYPRMHWDSHFGIIYDRLKELTGEIGQLG